MERNVVSFGVAVRKGFEARLYAYSPELIPIGEFNATLDFKIWSKRIIAINCYFTKIDSGNKFVLTVYCNNKTGYYKVNDSPVNFADCAIGKDYRIAIAKNAKQKIVLVNAEFISAQD